MVSLDMSARRKNPPSPQSALLGSPRTLLALIVAVAILVATLLALLSQLGGAGGSSASSEDVGKLYSGIPQNGTTLGKSTAPVTIYLYEDFQCPYCGQFSRQMFPQLVEDYVRGGKAKLISEPLTFLGPDSAEASRAALAAGEQNRYWPYSSLLFENQGEENSGYITSDFLEGLAQKTPGLDVSEWDVMRKENSLESELYKAQAKARSAGVDSTPTLIFSGPGGQETIDELRDYDQISQAIEQVDGS
jgi:protein-disulfide isomerase